MSTRLRDDESDSDSQLCPVVCVLVLRPGLRPGLNARCVAFSSWQYTSHLPENEHALLCSALLQTSVLAAACQQQQACIASYTLYR